MTEIEKLKMKIADLQAAYRQNAAEEQAYIKATYVLDRDLMPFILRAGEIVRMIGEAELELEALEPPRRIKLSGNRVFSDDDNSDIYEEEL